MAVAAITDFSGLQELGKRDVRCRTNFFVMTPAFLEEDHHKIHHVFVWNGSPAEVILNLHSDRGGWRAIVDVELGLMNEPRSGFAEYFLNQSFDILSLISASPFQCFVEADWVASEESHNRPHSVGAIVTIDDVDVSIRMGMLLYTCEDTLLKAISWYRRGLSSTDPLLSFLALWNSLETVSGKFHTRSDSTGKGSKEQIISFLSEHLKKSGRQFFNPSNNDLREWVKSSYELRQDIAHGLKAISPNSIAETKQAIPKLRSVVTALLKVTLDVRCKQNELIVEITQRADENKKAAAR